MSKLKVYDMSGASVAEMDVADSLLVSGKGEAVVHDAVVTALNAKRAGTASTLSKGEVRGSNRKPWRQKGTGRARAGYRQSPIWRGGAVAFGPHPRSYRHKMNKKSARLAFRRAITQKITAGEVRVLDELVFTEAKTRLFASLVKALEIAGPALFVVEKIDSNVAKASRNIPNIEVVRASDVNVHQLLRYPAVVVTRSGMLDIERRLGKKSEAPE